MSATTTGSCGYEHVHKKKQEFQIIALLTKPKARLQISQWDKWSQEFRGYPFLPLCARLQNSWNTVGKPCFCCTGRQGSQIRQAPNGQIQQLSHKTCSEPSFIKTQKSMTANHRSIIGLKAFSSWLKCSKLSFNVRLAVTSAWLQLKTGYWWVGRCWERVRGHMLHSSGRCLYLILVTSSSSLKGWHWQKLQKDLPIFLYYKEGQYDLSPLWWQEKKGMKKENLLHLKF